MRTNIWMPIFVADYLADTRSLSTEEHGAYLLLQFEYWRTGEPLPDDDKRLGRITGLGRRFKAIRPVLARYFQVADGVWRHRQLDEEMAKAQARANVARNNGRRGGRPTNANPAGTQRVLGAQPGTGPDPSPAPSSSPSPSPNVTHTRPARETPCLEDVLAVAVQKGVEETFARNWFNRKLNSVNHGFATVLDWQVDLLTYWHNQGQPRTEQSVHGAGRPESLGAKAMRLEEARKRLTAEITAAESSADGEFVPVPQRRQLRDVEAQLRGLPKGSDLEYVRRFRREAFDRAIAEHPGNPDSAAHDEHTCTDATRQAFAQLRKDAAG